jgi:hypothetical protein
MRYRDKKLVSLCVFVHRFSGAAFDLVEQTGRVRLLNGVFAGAQREDFAA